MSIISATMGSVPGTTANSYSMKLRAMMRGAGDSGGAAKSVSAAALGAWGGADSSTFTTSSVDTAFKASAAKTLRVNFNNSSGQITIDGTKLDLKGIADSTKERNLTFQLSSDDNILNVYRGSETYGFQVDMRDGKLIMNADGVTYKNADAARDASKASLIINNDDMGTAFTDTGNVDQVVINRQNGATFNLAGGNDKLFNFAKDSFTVDGGAGDDQVYSVGTAQAAAINTGATGGGLVKLLGNVTGGNITLGTGANILDATGYTLTDVTIADQAGAASSVVAAKSITGTGTVTLNGAETAVDVATLASNLTLGAGINSLVADAVADTTVITSTGTDSFQFKTLGESTIDASGAAATTSSVVNVTGGANKSTIKFGEGTSTLNAEKKTLNEVNVTDAAAGAITNILAGTLNNSTVTLSGTGEETVSSGLDISGAINNSSITLGDGAGTLYAKSVGDSTISMSAGGAFTQTVNVTGKMNDTSLTGGDGVDNVTIGSVAAATINLGAGNNVLSVTGTAADLTYTGTTGTDSVKIGTSLTGTNSFTMGAGANELVVGKAASNVTYTGGADADKITIGGALTGTNVINVGDGGNTLSVAGAGSNVTFTGGTGDDIVEFNGAVQNSTFNLLAGDNKFEAIKAGGGANAGMALTNVDITAGAGANTVTAGAYKTRAAGANNVITLGAGANSVTLGSITGQGAVGLTMTLDAGGTATQTVRVTGTTKNLTYSGSDGVDDILIGGAVSDSTFNLGAGNDSFTARKGATALQALKDVSIISTAGDDNITAGAYSSTRAGNVLTLTGGENTVSLSSITSSKDSITMAMTLGGTSTDSQSLTVTGAAKNFTYTGAAGNDTININGALSNSTINLGDGTNSLKVEKDGKGQAMTDLQITSSGASATSISGGKYNAKSAAPGKNSISLMGTGANNVSLTGIVGSATGFLTMELGGTSTAQQNLTVTGAVKNLKYTGAAGKDSITVEGAIGTSTINLGLGDDIITAVKDAKNQALSDVNITSTGGSNTITAGAYSASGAGNNSIKLDGAGANSVTLSSITASRNNRLAIYLAQGENNAQTLNVGGAIKNLDYFGAAGADSITVEGAISNSTFDLGDGANKLEAVKAGKGQNLTDVSISSGAGNTSITAGSLSAGAGSSTIQLGAGANVITLDSISGKGAYTANIDLSGGGANTQTVNVKGKASGLNYTGGGDVDNVAIQGALSNSTVNLGDGNNVLNVGKLADADNPISAVEGGYDVSGTTIIGGSGDDLVTVGTVKPGGKIELGAGTNNTVELKKTA